MTRLRRRMEEEFKLRGYSVATNKSYIATIKNLAKFHHRSPDQIGAEEVRAYLLHLMQEESCLPVPVNL